MLGPYIKSRGTEMSVNADLITMETYYVQQGETILKTSFSYKGQNVKKKILLPIYPLTYINLHIKYGSNPIRIF